MLPWWERGALCEPLRMAGVEVLDPWASYVPSRLKFLKPAIGGLLAIIQIALNIFRYRNSVISFYLPQSYWIGGAFAFFLRCKKTVMHRRGSNKYFEFKPRVFRRYESFLHQQMRLLIVNSSSLADQLVSEGAKNENIKVIFNGIELNEPIIDNNKRRNFRINLNLTENEVIFVCIANIIPYKGHLDLVTALANLDRPLNWRLILVGNDYLSYSKEIISLSESLGIEKNIILLGPRQDIMNILSAADVGVLASHQEGMPNAILEYMAAGLPVIATSVGGVPELVIDGETGILVPPLTPNRLCDAARALLDSPDIRLRFGSAGRRRIEQRFGVDLEVREYDRLYRTLAGG